MTNVSIGDSVTNIGDKAFEDCSQLASIFLMGNAPTTGSNVFANSTEATVYYLPGTTGWDEFSVAAEVPVVLWNPLIQASGTNFGVKDSQFGFNISGTTNIQVVVEACTNLANPVWIPLQSLKLTNGLVYFSEPFQVESPARFYCISPP